MRDIKVYKAKRIITMDVSYPFATHVAVQDNLIRGVGGDELGEYVDKVDETFADKIIMPGLVEGHAHLMAGAVWEYVYIGFQDRRDPQGKLWTGITNIEEVVARLREAHAAMKDADTALVAWGFDPIFLQVERLTRYDLDKVSNERPIVILHSNFHVMTVNSASLERVSYTESKPEYGIEDDGTGKPNGELREIAAMFPILRRLGVSFREMSRKPLGIHNYGKTCVASGVTTSADLLNDLPEEDLVNMLHLTSEESYPLRIASMLNAMQTKPEEVRERALTIKRQSSDKLRLGGVKIVVDGSIQGFSARLQWPGYINGEANGIWNIVPEQLDELVYELHKHDIQMHIHVNGDEAVEVAIMSLERALDKYYKVDHRHTLQHCQLVSEAQLRKAKLLGVCINLFANHVYYFGDQHRSLTVGEDKARRIDPCCSVLSHGIPLAIHSDAPVTPLGPLFTAHCAINRRTVSNHILGVEQQISVEQALYAITIGAAYTLFLDSEIGSIEIGKVADFAILEDDPYTVDKMALKDINIWGVVSGGKIHKSTW